MHIMHDGGYMKEKAAGYARLTQLVESHGSDFVKGQYEMRYSEGESNVDIARSMGVPWFVLHRWLVDNAPDSIENAKAARTEVKLDQAERDMECADIESVGLVKAQADFALRLAGKRFRREYGESVKVENTSVITDERLRTLSLNDLKRLVLEGEFKRLDNPAAINVINAEVVEI